ncbi:MAG: PepSY domain-containing protein [Alphaproteobacteria bacterium]|nr:PepSY domain-containing protein [Alphaproteobacteria bacterium]
MKNFLALTACAIMVASTAAFADSKPSDDEAAKIKEALSAWGCEGGALEKETEGTGVFEVDDAKCKDGQQYDFKLNSDYSVRSMTRD